MDKAVFIILYGKLILLMLSTLIVFMCVSFDAVGRGVLIIGPGNVPLRDQYKERIAKWNQQINKNPFSIDTRLQYARTLKVLFETTGTSAYLEQAADILQEAREMNSNSIEVQGLSMRIALARGEIAQVYESADKWYESTGHTEFLGVRGEAALLKGDYDRAHADILRFVKQKPGFRPWLLAANISRVFGNYGDSIDYLQRIPAEVANGSAYERAVFAFESGKHYLSKHELLRAQKFFESALELVPAFLPVLKHLACTYELRGAWQEAESLLSQAAKLQRQPATLARLALAKEMIGQQAEAIQLREEAMSRAKTGFKTNIWMAIPYAKLLLAQKGSEWRALQVVRTIYHQFPGLLEVNYLLAQAYYQNRQLQKARFHIGHALRVGSTIEEYYELKQLIERES